MTTTVTSSILFARQHETAVSSLDSLSQHRTARYDNLYRDCQDYDVCLEDKRLIKKIPTATHNVNTTIFTLPVFVHSTREPMFTFRFRTMYVQEARFRSC